MRPNVNGTFKLIERFTRTAPDALVYEFTINDPTWYTAPFTAKIPMTKNPEPMYEFACHEGNYSLTNILQGARLSEARGSEGLLAGKGPRVSTRCSRAQPVGQSLPRENGDAKPYLRHAVRRRRVPAQSTVPSGFGSKGIGPGGPVEGAATCRRAAGSGGGMGFPVDHTA